MVYKSEQHCMGPAGLDNGINPLSSDMKIHILLTALQTFLMGPYGTSQENLTKYQDILSLVINSFILIT